MLIFAFIELCYRLLLTVIGVTILSLFTLTGIIVLIIGIVKRKKHKGLQPKKKYPIVLITLGTVFICIPFFVVGMSVTDSIVHYVTREKTLTTTEQCEIIIEAVQNKEKEPIKELFCENAKNTLNLDTELDGFFDFIDGNIVSYDKPIDGGGGISSTEDGFDEVHRGGIIRNIQTDTGNVYTIYVFNFSIYKEYPDYVGIVILSIEDQNRYNAENDFPEDSIYEIKVDYPIP